MKYIIAIGVLSMLATTVAVADTTNNFEWPMIPSENYTWVPPNVGDPANVAIFRDILPWGSNADDQILTNNGIAFSVFGAADIGSVDLSPFDKVIISNQQPTSFISTVEANRAWFETYVSDGGCLLSELAHFSSDINPGVTYPGGYTYGANNCNNGVIINLPAHPIFNDPNPVASGDLQNWGCSSHGPISGPAQSVALVQNNDLDQGVACAELEFGSGYIVTTTQPYQVILGPNGYSENLVLYQPCGATPVETSTWGGIKSIYDD